MYVLAMAMSLLVPVLGLKTYSYVDGSHNSTRFYTDCSGLICGGSASTVGSCQPSDATSTASKIITCIGDSITQGVGATDPSKSYPAQLQALLGSNFQVNNIGSGCATMEDTPEAYKKSAQWNTEMTWRQFKQSDIFVILLGTNDSKKNIWNKSAFRAAYGEFIRAIKAQAPLATVVIAVPPPIAAEGACWGMQKQLFDAELPEIIAEIA